VREPLEDPMPRKSIDSSSHRDSKKKNIPAGLKEKKALGREGERGAKKKEEEAKNSRLKDLDEKAKLNREVVKGPHPSTTARRNYLYYARGKVTRKSNL